MGLILIRILGPSPIYRAAHGANGLQPRSEVSGTTQRAVNVRWVVPLTSLQAAPQENAPRPSAACAAL